ncbi:hypothetical protein ACNIV9_25365 [Escherichia coli]|nr:hypothetical protein [Escherichia coli]
MYFIGFLFYALVVYSYFFIDEIYEIINQSYILARAITIGMGSLYIYPLLIFTCVCLFAKKTEKYKSIVDSQTKLAASVSVSLGLIGTFQGLTAMVSSIAKSMGGEGDMAEKMNSMLSAISSALSAMSYAFLTSIVGVAVSVLLMLSLNFWLFYFKDISVKKNRNIIVNYPSLSHDNTSNIEEYLICINKNIEEQSLIQRKILESNKKLVVGMSETSGGLNCVREQLSVIIDIENKKLSEVKTYLKQLKGRLKILIRDMLE